MLRQRENLQTPTIRVDRSYEIDRFDRFRVCRVGDQSPVTVDVVDRQTDEERAAIRAFSELV